MTYLWIVPIVAECVVLVLIITSLLGGSYKDFPFLFGYLLSVLFGTVAGSAAYFTPALLSEYTRHYWIAETVQQVLVFCLVISLIHRTLKGRGRVLSWFGLGLVVIALVAIQGMPSANLSWWMTQLSRNLSFCAVLLNLVLWMSLIRHRPEDRRLLLISGGLGVQMAGKAIGHSLRQMSRGLITPGNMLIVLSHLLCLFIWWQAFREPGLRTSRQTGGVE
jgi:hypothetical protein